MDGNYMLLFAAANSLAWNLIAAAEFLRKNKKKLSRKNGGRSCWVKPWRQERATGGNIQFLLKEFKLANDLKSYKSYMLMDECCFQELLGYVEDDIAKKDTHLRKCIPPAERLAAVLRFLATGENYKELGENTMLSQSFLQQNIVDMCEIIYMNMKDKFLRFPERKSEWLQIAEEFERRWQFPLCLGALDGKHVAMTPPKKDAPLYYNYKGFHRVVLLAMSDANAKFTFVDVGRNGRISDGGIFRRSVLRQIIEESDKFFPDEKIIGNNRMLSYVIVADNAFPLLRNVMTPYSRSRTEPSIINFNSRLSRARQCIERSFGILSNRFQILQHTIKLDAEKTTKIILCCCVLHNFLIERSIWYQNSTSRNLAEPEGIEIPSNEDLEHTIRENRRSEEIRKSFADYFFNEGNIY